MQQQVWVGCILHTWHVSPCFFPTMDVTEDRVPPFHPQVNHHVSHQIVLVVEYRPSSSYQIQIPFTHGWWLNPHEKTHEMPMKIAAPRDPSWCPASCCWTFKRQQEIQLGGSVEAWSTGDWINRGYIYIYILIYIIYRLIEDMGLLMNST